MAALIPTVKTPNHPDRERDSGRDTEREGERERGGGREGGRSLIVELYSLTMSVIEQERESMRERGGGQVRRLRMDGRREAVRAAEV